MFTNINERMWLLFMLVRLTKRTKFLVRVRSFIKRTNTNELPAERFTKCLLNVWFVCSPTNNGLNWHLQFLKSNSYKQNNYITYLKRVSGVLAVLAKTNLLLVL
ncbi:hypothetical protein Hanom_Chr01g00078761 [Helianthus anomalus]